MVIEENKIEKLKETLLRNVQIGQQYSTLQTRILSYKADKLPLVFG
jgi:hypothetical protein